MLHPDSLLNHASILCLPSAMLTARVDVSTVGYLSWIVSASACSGALATPRNIDFHVRPGSPFKACKVPFKTMSTAIAQPHTCISIMLHSPWPRVACIYGVWWAWPEGAYPPITHSTVNTAAAACIAAPLPSAAGAPAPDLAAGAAGAAGADIRASAPPADRAAEDTSGAAGQS